MTRSTYRKITNEYSFIINQSHIAGVGVFAAHPILKGTLLKLFPGEGPRIIKKFPREAEALFQHYCIKSDRGFECPANFGRIEIGWYLNHSKEPNIFHKNYTYYAKRNIRAGDELTLDYDTL